jgi:Domain of unknown function (DUF4265)
MTRRVKLCFPFTNSEGEQEVETMWAVEREDGYELDNIPFYVKELALGDVVSATAETDGALYFSKLVRAQGHSTLRLLFSSKENIKPVRDALRQMRCDSEQSDLPSLVAVDVPPEVPYARVKEFLDGLKRDGVLEYQEACLGFL